MTTTKMVNNSALTNSFRLSIKFVDQGLEPRVMHARVQALRSTISALSGLEHTAFSFFYGAQRGAPSRPGLRANGDAVPLAIGLQCEPPLDKFRVVLRRVGDWLDRTAQEILFAVEIPPAHTITLQTSQAKVLAHLLPLGEALLSPYELYLNLANSYVSTFGELTPAAKANLSLVRQRLRLPSEEANELNARAVGPFKSLTEKYQHFRKELLAYAHQSDPDDEFWQLMQTKASTMSLPDTDAKFLKSERLETLRQEADRAHQQAEAEAEAKRQQRRDRQQRLLQYQQAFEALVLDSLSSLSSAPEVDQFRQGVMTHLTEPEFNRGRLSQTRDFYGLSPQETGGLEKIVLDELYLLSDLL
ncbi:MAG: hypothetical protein WBG38_03780 [Nodosilinea sp.]